MHEWYTRKDTNIYNLIDYFIGYRFNTDYSGEQEVNKVVILNTIARTEDDAIKNVTSHSYGSNSAYLTAFTSKEVSKAYKLAFNDFITKYNDYRTFKNNLTISYGRISSKVTCPNCKSSINLSYGKKFKYCPICGSAKIISDSNWKILESKKKLVIKTSEKLSKEAVKNNVSFICGIEWHC